MGVVDQSTSSGTRATAMTARGEQLCANERDRCGRPAAVAFKHRTGMTKRVIALE